MMIKLKLVFAALPMLLLSAACNNKPDDAEIQKNVTEHLQQNNEYSGINASVSEGIVTLDGNCEGENCGETIAANVKDIEGVDSVTNNIKSFIETDLTLRTTVQSIISKYPGVEADVAMGQIVLRGSISRDQIQLLMNELKVLDAKQIDNQLAIQ